MHTCTLIAHVNLSLGFEFEIMSTRSRPLDSFRAPCPLTPSKAIAECAAVRVSHPGMEVLVVRLAACLVTLVSVDAKRAKSVVVAVADLVTQLTMCVVLRLLC